MDDENENGVKRKEVISFFQKTEKIRREKMTIGYASMKVSSNLADSSFRRMWGREACLRWVKEVKKCEQAVDEKF